MRFAVSGLYGIIGFSRTTEDGETTSALHLFHRTVWKRGEEKKEVKDKQKKGIPTEDLLEVLSELPDLMGIILRLLNALWRSAAIEQLKGAVRVGLGDPELTGMLVGLIHAIGGIATPWLDVLDVTLLPVFDEAVLEGELEMRLRLRLLGIVVPAIRLFLKKPTRQLMKAGRG